MWIRRSFFCVVLGACLTSAGNLAASPSELALSLAYRVQQSRANSVDPSVLYTRPIFSWLNGRLGARLTTSNAGLEAFDYALDLRAPIYAGLGVAMRVFQGNQLITGAGITQFLFRGDGKIPVFSWLTLIGALGWQERLVALGSVPILPGLSRTSFSEHDFAVAAGFEITPVERWKTSFKLSTFEDLDAYNLNSPYFQLELEHNPARESYRLFAYSRYRLLLGFGRRDELAFGVGIRFDFSPPFSSGM